MFFLQPAKKTLRKFSVDNPIPSRRQDFWVDTRKKQNVAQTVVALMRVERLPRRRLPESFPIAKDALALAHEFVCAAEKTANNS